MHLVRAGELRQQELPGALRYRQMLSMKEEPDEGWEEFKRTTKEGVEREGRMIVAFQVVGPAHNMMIYALLANGTLWRQWRSTILEPMNWERIEGPSE